MIPCIKPGDSSVFEILIRDTNRDTNTHTAIEFEFFLILIYIHDFSGFY